MVEEFRCLFLLWRLGGYFVICRAVNIKKRVQTMYLNSGWRKDVTLEPPAPIFAARGSYSTRPGFVFDCRNDFIDEFSRLAEHITKLADTFYGGKFIALLKPPSRHKYRVLCLTSLTAEFVIHSNMQKKIFKVVNPTRPTSPK